MDADELERSKWSEEKKKAWEKKWEEHAHEVWMGRPFTAPCAKCRWRRKDRVPEVGDCLMYPDNDGAGPFKPEAVMYEGAPCKFFREDPDAGD